MQCPMFIDSTRECITKIEYIIQTELHFCTADAYEDCPFFKVINNVGNCCENIASCSMFKHFATKDFALFMKITKEYCISENKINCQRYKIKKTGRTPSIDLSPDGTTIKE